MSCLIIDLNAERKRRAGLADSGRCPKCGAPRVMCRVVNECGDEEK